MSDMSAALSRLAFLHDMCPRHMSDMSGMWRECIKNNKARAKRANLLKALNRLAFLISTCTRQRAACANRRHASRIRNTRGTSRVRYIQCNDREVANWQYL